MEESFKTAFELSSAKLGSASVSHEVKRATLDRYFAERDLQFYMVAMLQGKDMWHTAVVLPVGESLDVTDAITKTDWVFFDGKNTRKFISVSGFDRDKIVDTVFNALKEPMAGYTLYANIGPKEKRMTRALEDRAVRLG